LHEIIRSGTGYLPPTPIWVSLINDAQLLHGLSELGKTDLDPAGDKADHTSAVLIATTDLIYQSPLESDSDGGREVYTMGNRVELSDKMIEEI
jgi:hypothetical protein